MISQHPVVGLPGREEVGPEAVAGVGEGGDDVGLILAAFGEGGLLGRIGRWRVDLEEDGVLWAGVPIL